MSADWATFRPNLKQILSDYVANQAAIDRTIVERELEQKAAGNTSPWVVLRLRQYGPAYGVLVAYRGIEPAYEVTAWPEGDLHNDSALPNTVAGPISADDVIPILIHANGSVRLRISWSSAPVAAGVYIDTPIPTDSIIPDA